MIKTCACEIKLIGKRYHKLVCLEHWNPDECDMNFDYHYRMYLNSIDSNAGGNKY